MAAWLNCVNCGRESLVKNALGNFTRRSRLVVHARGIGAASSPSPEAHRIVIHVPKKKKRDELSILKALASTVKKDFHSPHYKYIDDPYLIPASSLEKRSYALAKAAGKKAARYVVNRYPENFADNPAEPTVEAFMPPAGSEHPEDTEEGLKERIRHHNPILAFQSYRCLKDKGVVVEETLLNDLLDLLCMYNSMDPIDHLTSDENFFRRDIGQDNTKKIRKTWNDHGAAEELFLDLDEANSRAYCSLIRGRAKYYQVDKAHELFREMREKGMRPDVQTFNAILKAASFRSEHPEKRWDYVKEILSLMAKDELQPNLFTFNNVLYTLTRSNRSRDCTQWVMQTLNEMKKLEIEPSLSSWLFAIQVFYASPESQSPILYDIIKELEGKDLTLHEETDLEFISTAMVKCFVNLKDMDLAYRIDALLNHGNNMKFIGDGFKEGIYYTHFVRLLCMFDDIGSIMYHYDRVTPHAYTPSFTALDDLLRAIELNEGYQYLPKIWSDFVLFEYMRRTDLVEPLLALMARKKQETPLQDIFVQISQQIKQKWEDDAQNRNLLRPLEFTAPMVTSLAMINLNAENFDQAWEFFEIYRHNRRNMTGFISEECLVRMADHCLLVQDFTKIMEILKTMADFAYSKFDVIADKTKADLNLSPEQCNAIDDLV